LLKNYLTPQELQQAKAEKLERKKDSLDNWPKEYINLERGTPYKPHHQDEHDWVYDTEHRRLLCKGGWGGGKSVAGIIRDLERIKVGAHGILISPDFEHFKRSLWPEFRRWCPWNFVVPRQRYRQDPAWEPGKPFQMNFTTKAVVYCGGMKEDQVASWEGPNVNWAHFDECRKHKTAGALKVLDSRVRIPMGGYKPQLWLTTTPRKHWLHEYFGPVKEDGEDPRKSFKESAFVITLLTLDNEENLETGYVEEVRKTLTEAEARVNLEAEWEDIEDTEKFLPSMTLWDLCQGEIPALTKHEPMVLAVDAAVGRTSGWSDCFGLLGVTRHPDPKYRHNQLFIRYIRAWQAKPGNKIDFDQPRSEIRYLCENYNVVMICYDPHQLHDMMQGLNKENIGWFFEFSQGTRRLEADRQLLDLILERRIWHNGDPVLREHISNANRKLTDDGKRLRIVKREEDLKIDLSVCLSMASHQSLYLNI